MPIWLAPHPTRRRPALMPSGEMAPGRGAGAAEGPPRGHPTPEYDEAPRRHADA